MKKGNEWKKSRKNKKIISNRIQNECAIFVFRASIELTAFGCNRNGGSATTVATAILIVCCFNHIELFFPPPIVCEWQFPSERYHERCFIQLIAKNKENELINRSKVNWKPIWLPSREEKKATLICVVRNLFFELGLFVSIQYTLINEIFATMSSERPPNDFYRTKLSLCDLHPCSWWWVHGLFSYTIDV